MKFVKMSMLESFFFSNIYILKKKKNTSFKNFDKIFMKNSNRKG